ncbi:Fibrinogen-like protein A,Ryncolin-4,Angiopoietin-related protein 7,Angiopoietin-related protein 1,Ficolin-3,Ficolin-1-B,Techylectin-5A,Ficolin-2,Ryncolin-1,Tenascin-R,Fibrinogen-like protein 1,Angiopoietin-1,Tenascin-X,Fibrinogen C domain-containing protein 1-A,Tenascin-N,Veficolin-1,Ryncolin-3,Tenascin,Fibrinogen C domain-containing protein 1,Ryncolin-2,Techylectin-5B,Angiopoietin-related protein 2,Angiopoietin-2,Microfibril-associated glycoprotein 4,Ficolin-1-A,Ficolin-1,Fibrinogen C domain-containing p|uniref:Fibrinogen C-terminal domain-containing protein n=1 Tax=Mytilus coruscus TaxID=42192 RepID=A0A6J8C444_MYTCO|nr:Fibrinogen-like protein A,Ryncolin-4,Angiopoietin-related protein 7,Angiopoietin-related protein 1,Ficolin-3,Ficolin-1-B,Techylectin-5A,Ficolin-2,Ryncolin-1,Tenascin-R,Fibrinogen-like protein 1,Angiopoietin-1,Tenascin-X,Fibrinogen C domain-containing protein 1-A,Tenascin-N,Veficolin-1,Ryncolin-3,Tenascin,Fibrinogen C domain-containing protein 1,Ryncolin-2,Techylectin-5B,Angiopoietin-related protein 2,Angiopoietin-2,Microfibril-associated glycoprotein 4,Ficolin-1-A,Ficolin-1,Fibrinogen C domain-c
MEKCLLFIGLICSVLLAGVKSTNTGDDLVETPVVDNQNVPLLAMFDMTKVNKRIMEYISDTFEMKMSNLVKMKLEEVLLSLKIDEDVKQYIENMKGNLTLNIKKEIKDYFDDMKQNSTDDISEAHNHRDCSDLDRKKFRSGVYKIFPEGKAGFNVYCDMETDGGGWTVFQRRQDGKVDFYRGWTEYVKGFGDIKTEFWLGNDKLNDLTSQGNYELRVNLMDFNGDKAYAKYSTFYIGDQSTNYILTVNGYSGTAGDALKFHNTQAFWTKDKDNSGGCAEAYKGGWWYAHCHHTNLNGLYIGNKKDTKGIRWWQWKGDQSMKTSSMMIRRI